MKANSIQRWGAVAALLLLTGAVALALAGEETPKARKAGRMVFFDGQSWLGVHISDITAEKAKELKLAGEYGVLVEEVEEESPAAKAGLQAQDVILSFADERVRGAEQLGRLVRETPAGRTVNVQVSRDGQARTLAVTLEERRGAPFGPGIWMGRAPMVAPAPMPPGPPPHFDLEMPDFDVEILTRGPQLGISGDELTPQLASYFGVQQGKGVLVREVMPGTSADKAGVKAGDVIIRVDAEAVATVGELRRALRRQREGKQVSLTIVRNRAEQTIKVELEETPRRTPERLTRLIEEGIEIDSDAVERMIAHLEATLQEKQSELESLQQTWEESLQGKQAQWEEKLHQAGEQLRQAEEQLRHQLESEEFQQKMQQLEEKLRQLYRQRDHERIVI